MKLDRKGHIEQVLVQAEKCNGNIESVLSWQRLCNELRNLSSPESRPPRFNALLRAIWVASTNEQS